jgi:hypothetical protein
MGEYYTHLINPVNSQNGPPDFLDYLRDDRVAKGTESSQSTGKPINQATHRGFSCPPAAVRAGSAAFTAWVSIHCMFPRRLPAASSFALGVGHNPDPFSPLRGTDGSSRNKERPPAVACRLQVSKHVVECQPDEPSNVLSNDPSGSLSSDDVKH